MTSPSGASSQAIALPQGGGALRGIGETFSPDLFTGTGKFTVPISLLPGRNGFQPKIDLVYSTGQGNGPFGLGWRLSVPGISRKTSKGVPRYQDGDDVFVLSGAEDLVPITRSPLRTRYRPRTEGLFARIDRHLDVNSGHDYWEVASKDGLVSHYGTPGAAASDLATVADPSDTTKVFAWKLTRTRDPFGNRIEYAYARDAGQDGPHHWDQTYLDSIRYADHGEPSDRKFLISVRFEYEDRPDPYSEYRSGFEIRTRRRCMAIHLHTHAEVTRRVRSYRFVYVDARADLADRIPLNKASLLSRIEVIGHDGDTEERLPPLEFDYTRFDPQRRDFFALSGRDLPARSLASPDLALVDLFGNGLPDFVEMNGSARYWRNLGDGRFDVPRQMPDAPAGVRLGDPGVQFIDANGDGRTDLLVANGVTAGYFPTRYQAPWDRKSFKRYQHAPSFDLQDPEVRLVDLDGDGVTDAIRSGSRFELFFNDADRGWGETRRVERRLLADFPNVNFSDPRVRWADMTGDGLQDIVLIHDGNVEYWPNLGYGNWGRRVRTSHAPRFAHGYDPRQILVGDVDGDGVADLLFLDHRRVILWINQSGNGWSEPIEIQGTPPISNLDAVQLVDLLGSGISGVLWSKDAERPGAQNYHFLDVTAGLKPYLLAEMNNHMGAITRVQYRPSTQEYLRDQANRQARWRTPLPFPVQVVSRVEVIDELSHGKLGTEYQYHHGYWDGAEREFRGFGLVEHFDTESFETYHRPNLHGEAAFIGFDTDDSRRFFSPPALTRNWFHLGPVGDEFGEWQELDYHDEYWLGDPSLLERPAEVATLLKSLPRRARRDALRALRGSPLRTEVYALDGSERQDRPYTVGESIHGLREESEPEHDDAERPRIFFAHPLAQRTTQWERGDDPLSSFSCTTDRDAYGQPTQSIAIACPRGWRDPVSSMHTDYLATLRATDYARGDDAATFIVDRVARTTQYEIAVTSAQSLVQLQQAIRSGSIGLRVIAQTLHHYDGPAFQGLPVGEVGNYGALVRSESLVLTEKVLSDAYRSDDPFASGPPPFLQADAAPPWSGDYPQRFRNGIAPRAGYRFEPGDAVHARGWFVDGARHRYDFQLPQSAAARGLPRASRDAIGNESKIDYDAFDLLPVRVTDPAGLAVEAEYDYRVLQPSRVTDPNGNRSAVGITPLGLVAWTAVMGKAGAGEGDTEQDPGTRRVYDFHAFANSPAGARQPVSVRSIRRVHHVNDADVPLPQRDETIESIEYSDGFGRLLQARAQAEDLLFGDPSFGGATLPSDQSDVVGTQAAVVGRQRGPDDPVNVVISGWQVYDNKGRVVEKYEPFFSTGWDFASPLDAEMGRKVTLFHDPRGQVIRTVNPDGSEQRVVHGVPVDRSNPESFTPTPWEAYTYDASDNAGRTHGTGDPSHWNTPASIEIDALGRTIRAVARNGQAAGDEIVTRSTYDIRGNLLTITDALGRIAFRHAHDLANRVLRIDSIDAGLRRTVVDALGRAIEGRDSKGALVLTAYDCLSRPIAVWARDDAAGAVTLRQRLEYGDAGSPEQPEVERAANRQFNRLGALARHFDEAGVVEAGAYDFKGNLLDKTRRVVSDDAILAAFSAPPPDWAVTAFRVDWDASDADDLLAPVEYRTSSTFDGLNRVSTLTYPADVDGRRAVLRPGYNRAGALERVALDDTTFVERIAYDAKGQRCLIAYGNGVMTRHAYDPLTFRLTRLRSERFIQTDGPSFQPTGAPLQDFGYAHDLAGNITRIRDRTPGSGIPNTVLGIDALDRSFAYDAIHRLISATGREHDLPATDLPWLDQPKTQDPNLTRSYAEAYTYDPLGNFLELSHLAGAGGFNRQFTLQPGNNRLSRVDIGQISYDYLYDANGNMTRETTSRHFEWDHADRMKVFRIQPAGAEPSVHAHYLYDAAGQRVKKLVRKQGGLVEVTVYIDGIFEYQNSTSGNATLENNTLHVMDDQSRIALLRVGAPFPDDSTPEVKYQLGDHLGTSQLVVDDSGAWINREEVTPYGETSFGGFARKRYRFSGTERDEESGLNYHGARYFAAWSARWVSPDPAGGVDGVNLFQYSLRRRQEITFTS